MSYSGHDLTRTAAARSSGRRRRGARPPRERRALEGFWGRSFAAVLAGAEAALLAWLVVAPLLPVREVTVSGLNRLTREQVVVAAGLDVNASVFTIDGDSIRRRLMSLPWVRTAAVQPLLPDRVAIAVEEWRPVALYKTSATGDTFFLSDQGVVLDRGEPEPALPLIIGSGAPDPEPNDHPLDAQLLQALVHIRDAFPSLYSGQQAAAFQIDCSGILTLVTDKGVRIIFGRVLTPEQFNALAPKLASLKAVAGQPEVQKGPVDYINLENANEPAVHFKGQTAPATPGGSARPSSTTSPSPAIQAVTSCR
jgi:cell division protein FtsQ